MHVHVHVHPFSLLLPSPFLRQVHNMPTMRLYTLLYSCLWLWHDNVEVQVHSWYFCRPARGTHIIMQRWASYYKSAFSLYCSLLSLSLASFVLRCIQSLFLTFSWKMTIWLLYFLGVSRAWLWPCTLKMLWTYSRTSLTWPLLGPESGEKFKVQCTGFPLLIVS